MSEYEKAREKELLEFAQKCKDAGLRVFFSEWRHDFDRKSYFHASDGIGIAYVQNSNTNFGYFSLSISYKGSKKFGSGCSIKDWQEWRNPQVQDVINACAMRQAPAWLIERENQNRSHQQFPLQPEFYKNVDEWINAQSKFCKIVEL